MIPYVLTRRRQTNSNNNKPIRGENRFSSHYREVSLHVSTRRYPEFQFLILTVWIEVRTIWGWMFVKSITHLDY